MSCSHCFRSEATAPDDVQALDLNRRNVDAWVARGAAYANQHAFPRAVSDLQTALGQSGMPHFVTRSGLRVGQCWCNLM